VHTTSFDATVASLSAVVQDAMEEAIPLGIITETKFPYWCSSSLRNLQKRITFTNDLKRRNPTAFTKNFPFIVSWL
jgi:hypothetical protein